MHEHFQIYSIFGLYNHLEKNKREAHYFEIIYVSEFLWRMILIFLSNLKVKASLSSGILLRFHRVFFLSVSVCSSWLKFSNFETLIPKYLKNIWLSFLSRQKNPRWRLLETWKSRGRVANTSVSHLEGLGFESWPADWLFWPRFSCYSSVPPDKCLHSTFNYATTASFHVLSNLAC
jgi:hypothetical protein